MSSFTPIGDPLDKKKAQANQAGDSQESTEVLEVAEAVFAELFGADLALHAKPQFLKNRTLTVTCSSAAMAQEIRQNQPKIVAAINKKMGKKEVDRIRYLA